MPAEVGHAMPPHKTPRSMAPGGAFAMKLHRSLAQASISWSTAMTSDRTSSGPHSTVSTAESRLNRAAASTSAWASVTLGELPTCDVDRLIGRLSTAAALAGFDIQQADQTVAWRDQLDVLRRTASLLVCSDPSRARWTVLLEYPIPRRGKRIDAMLIADRFVAVLEFKVGKETFDRADVWQAQDYQLDLRDFHEASRGIPVEALLVATAAPMPDPPLMLDASTGIAMTNASHLAAAVQAIAARHISRPERAIDAQAWALSGYRPTPTIVEAARRVFAGHGIKDLSHSYADNLTTTTEAIVRAIHRSKDSGLRTICFVTGVPGAGKTLAGLTAMQDARSLALGEGAASFMSGNGPLVRVLREALVRDRVSAGAKRNVSERETELLIQNIHQFLTEYGVNKPGDVPPDHVIAFDEAQRAWHAGKLAKRHKAIRVSEPRLLLDIMARPPHWAVVVALVGGGQEIHDGEAGLEEWGKALQSCGAVWDVVVSPEVLVGGESVAGHRLFSNGVPSNVRVHEEQSMHLAVSVRAPRAQRLAEWVNAVLRADAVSARTAMDAMPGYRVMLTRDLHVARGWLREVSTRETRAGLLASSGALRLRAEGLELDPEFHRGYPIERWFLDPRGDFRSSHSLEVAMTEFECQGLELDFVGLCWGDDMTIRGHPPHWHPSRLMGRHWKTIRDAGRAQYHANKYRVLLTRAREGLVLWVPRGEERDPTRAPEPLNDTAAFLIKCGAVPLG